MKVGDNVQCPVCHGLDPELRIGLDEIFKRSTRDEYEDAKLEYDRQIEHRNAHIHEFYSEFDEKQIKISLYARCQNCKTTWKFTTNIEPLLGDE